MASALPDEVRIARLARMSRAEIFERIRQKMRARADGLRYRFNLEFPEITGLSSHKQSLEGQARPRFFFSPEQVPELCALLKDRFPSQVDEIVGRAERVCRHEFDLLGYRGLECGKEIDWHLDPVHGKRAPRKLFYEIRYLDFQEVGDSKIIWELNRHQHFVTLAKAYRLTGEQRFAHEISGQWDHWHAQNPYPLGINWASSLEVAFRSLSWLWVYFLLAGTPVMTTAFRERWLRAQAVNGRHISRYLSTYFSPNTHLLGEAVALFFLGSLCEELHFAPLWKRRGWEIIEKESQRQVRKDGFHCEQSTYYHVYALDFLLHAAVLASVNGETLPSNLEPTLEKMLDALLLLGRGGLVPNFGDDDGGRVFDATRNRSEHLLDPLATGTVLFQRGDFKFAAGNLREETLWLLGEEGAAEWDRITAAAPNHGSAVLADSGMYVMASGEPGRQLVVDAGPMGSLSGGHGHADALSIWVGSSGRALLIDSGTFEYVGEGTERNVLRGTGAHNTLRVDGAGQADVVGPFSWGSLPKAKAEQWVQGHTFDLFVGSHDGYTRLADPVIHRRWIFSSKGQFWLVRDVAEGAGEHRLEVSWHFGPEMQMQEENIFGMRHGEDRLAIVTVEGHGWSEEGHKDWWSPCYGQKQGNLVLNFSTVARLPAEFVSVLVPLGRESSHAGKIVADSSQNCEGEVKAYRFTTPGAEYGIYFARPGSAWKCGAWAGDAEFACWVSNAGKELQHLIISNGTWLSFEDKRLIDCERKVSWCELVLKQSGPEVFSSDREAVAVQVPPQVTSDAGTRIPRGDAEVTDLADSNEHLAEKE